MIIKKNFKIIGLIIISSVLFSACTKKNAETNLDLTMTQNPTPTITSNNIIPSVAPIITNAPGSSSSSIKTTGPIVVLTTKDGQIIISLYSKEAPKTVANFIKKIEAGFYKDLIFHRVISGFMAQGGDPTGTGSGGGQIASEINSVPFVRGSVGLARGDDKTISNDSQFFICFTTEGCQHLTGDYVNFGEVVSGLDVLDKIKQGDKIINLVDLTK